MIWSPSISLRSNGLRSNRSSHEQEHHKATLYVVSAVVFGSYLVAIAFFIRQLRSLHATICRCCCLRVDAAGRLPMVIIRLRMWGRWCHLYPSLPGSRATAIIVGSPSSVKLLSMTTPAVIPMMEIWRSAVPIAVIGGSKEKGDAKASAIRGVTVIICRIGGGLRVPTVGPAAGVTPIWGGS